MYVWTGLNFSPQYFVDFAPGQMSRSWYSGKRCKVGEACLPVVGSIDFKHDNQIKLLSLALVMVCSSNSKMREWDWLEMCIAFSFQLSAQNAFLAALQSKLHIKKSNLEDSNLAVSYCSHLKLSPELQWARKIYYLIADVFCACPLASNIS